MNREEIKKFYGWSDRDFDIMMINGLPCELTAEGLIFDLREVGMFLCVTDIKEDDLIWLLMRRLKLSVYSIEDESEINQIILTLSQLEEELKNMGVIKNDFNSR